MYRYDEFDAQLVSERVAQFRTQVQRRLSGELSEDQFKPLRLMNGVYLQLHAYMLRVAIPYGVLSSKQLRTLAHIAEKYDKGYGHFTTRQNIQFNWPRLVDIPDILEELASVEMHAIQTSGNCIRNITSDPWAGVAADEIEDPRPLCELLRQWSTFHPEFSFLPRKFKLAVTGAPNDRAAVKVHDIGLRLHRDAAGAPGFEVIVGGGQGRTPMIGKTICTHLPRAQLLPYLEAIMRVYNLHGRRDNKYKARVKILVHEIGVAAFRKQVEEQYRAGGKGDESDRPERSEDGGDDACASTDAHSVLAEAELQRIAQYFAAPYQPLDDTEREASHSEYETTCASEPAFALWAKSNVAQHKEPGYAIVTVSLKPPGGVPGDLNASQMRLVADLAEQHSYGELRVTHKQNLVLPNVRLGDTVHVWQQLSAHQLGSANAGLPGDIICCPGLDYCTLATTRSIPVAQEISRRYADIARQHRIGPLSINISGCINACGHHHVANIGILGIEKKGREFYQLTLGGSADEDAAIGRVLGPGFAASDIADAVERVIDTYLRVREAGESFLQTYRRTGTAPFKREVYGAD